MKAVQDEIEAQEATQLGGALGAGGGALMGAAAGSIPHKLGQAINTLRPKHTPRVAKPGFRMAGGLTGLILGGGLGAGMAAIMKRDSEAARVLGKIQAQNGELDSIDQANLGRILGDMYNSPSQLM